MDLWQSPKSMPQILTLRSDEAVTMSVLSYEISMLRTGNLWPYRERKNCSHKSTHALTSIITSYVFYPWSYNTHNDSTLFHSWLSYTRQECLNNLDFTFRVSTKNTLTVLSSRDTAIRRWSGLHTHTHIHWLTDKTPYIAANITRNYQLTSTHLYRTHRTSSGIFNVFVWTSVSCLLQISKHEC